MELYGDASLQPWSLLSAQFDPFFNVDFLLIYIYIFIIFLVDTYIYNIVYTV